ncbi:MAG TPA: carbohydrate kinase family protein [Thermoleophilia bacterium]|nr:carbohydrate kinase family protein [Thermoleophilia bacterium]
MRPVDLIGCGALNLDLIYRLPRSFPLWDELGPPGSEQQMDERVRQMLDDALAHVTPVRAGGGQAANTAHALARMGYRAAMVGRVGSDEDGAFLLDELTPAEGRLVARAGETGRVYVLLDEDGERRNLVWPAANDQFAPADVPRRPPRARYALFTSFAGDGPLAAQLTLLERLPSETEVCFDPGEIYARKGVKRLLPLIARCSYLFATEAELQVLCGLGLPEALDFLLNAGVGLVVCKMGARGARLVGRRVDLYVPPQPAEVVDVTGAGDLFAAGFIAGMLEQVGLEAAGRLAAWAASRGIAGVGRSSYPDEPAWRARLAEERGEAP